MTILQDQLGGKDPTQVTFADITGEHRYKRCGFWLVMDYFVMLITIVLRICFLGSDIYTLIAIYALNNWDEYHSMSYVPILVYRIVFTVCIGLSMIFLLFGLITGIRIFNQGYVIKSYVHTLARELNSLQSFERFCIYEDIDTKCALDWFALTIYKSLHYSIFMWLFADTPRQMLNGATIANSISNSFTSSNVIAIIRNIGQTNKKEAVLLSFMTFSFVVWLCFTAKYILIILSSICVVPMIKNRSGMSFSKTCKSLVAQSVMEMYEKEEKKKRKSMMRKRRYPSIIKDNSVADLNYSRDEKSDPFSDDAKYPYTENYVDPSDDSLQQPQFGNARKTSVRRSIDPRALVTSYRGSVLESPVPPPQARLNNTSQGSFESYNSYNTSQHGNTTQRGNTTQHTNTAYNGTNDSMTPQPLSFTRPVRTARTIDSGRSGQSSRSGSAQSVAIPPPHVKQSHSITDRPLRPRQETNDSGIYGRRGLSSSNTFTQDSRIR